MDTFNKIRGEELTRKEKEFDAAIQRIEEKYIDFFKSRKSMRSEYDVHDRLHNHIVLGNVAGQTGFGFSYDSDLPEHIRKECIDAFRKAFS
jgi:ribosomal protein S5